MSKLTRTFTIPPQIENREQKKTSLVSSWGGKIVFGHIQENLMNRTKISQFSNSLCHPEGSSSDSGSVSGFSDWRSFSVFNCAVKIISWFLLVVDSLAPKCPNQTEKLKTRMLSISHQDKMLAITSKVDICTKVAHHVHVVYLIATFHIRRWRGMMVTILKANKAAKWPTGDRVPPLNVL